MQHESLLWRLGLLNPLYTLMTIIIIYPRVHVHQPLPSARIWVFVLCVGVDWGLVCWWGSVGWVEWWCAIPSSSTTRTVESERLGAETTTTTTTTTDWMMDSFQWFCSCWQWRWRINCTIHFNSSSSHNYDDVLLPSVSDACLAADEDDDERASRGDDTGELPLLCDNDTSSSSFVSLSFRVELCVTESTRMRRWDAVLKEDEAIVRINV